MVKPLASVAPLADNPGYTIIPPASDSHFGTMPPLLTINFLLLTHPLSPLTLKLRINTDILWPNKYATLACFYMTTRPTLSAATYSREAYSRLIPRRAPALSLSNGPLPISNRQLETIRNGRSPFKINRLTFSNRPKKTNSIFAAPGEFTRPRLCRR